MSKTTREQIGTQALLALAKTASYLLAEVSEQEKQKTLHLMAAKIIANKADIFAANEKDIANAKTMLDANEINASALKRLVLDEDKLGAIVEGIKQVAELPTPIGKTLLARQLDDDLNLYQITCPIGLIAVIFESRPDALPQIISLCFKSGNAAVLKGGKEAEQTNTALFAAICEALKQSGISPHLYALSHKREVVADLLNADGLVDLIIPRGSNELVRHIMDNTRIPVLGHAAGICHVYVDKDGDLEKALAVCVDSKINYPSACNAVETILVHKDIASRFLPKLFRAFKEAKVEVRYAQDVSEHADVKTLDNLKEGNDEDFGQEFSDLIVAVKTVDSLEKAIEHINTFSSNHTDSIVTENAKNAEKFFAQVNSAGVFQNASTRFADGFRYGFGAEVGISNGKLHPRGPVGLEGLVTYKYKLIGKGHIVKDYSGANARKFKHKDIQK